MGKKNKKDRITYSTNPDFEFEEEFEEEETLPPYQQELRVFLERKDRGGKTAVVVKNFIGSTFDLEKLGKELKAACGVGGSVKNGEIILQGEMRDKVIQLLEKKKYKVKRVGG